MTKSRRLFIAAALAALLGTGLWFGWRPQDLPQGAAAALLARLSGSSGDTAARAPSSGREFPLPPLAAGSRSASSPWAANAQRWIRRDIRALLRDARASPQTGSYYFGSRAARYCTSALAEGGTSELVRRITTESAADPVLLQQRIAAARALLAPCEGMTFQDALALATSLEREGDRVGDVRLVLDRKIDAVIMARDSTATPAERQRLLEEVLFLDDPDLINVSIGMFQAGSVIAGHTVIDDHGDRIVEDAMLLVLCGSYGECNRGYGSADEICALRGNCSATRFERIRRDLSAADWERTYALYLGIQGALGAKDPSAFRVKWPELPRR